MGTTPKSDEVTALACKLANSWSLFRRQSPRVVDQMYPYLTNKLDELERLTRGDARRCECLAGRDSNGERHDAMCPASPPRKPKAAY